jgi:hypothetical protein
MSKRAFPTKKTRKKKEEEKNVVQKVNKEQIHWFL